MQRMWVVGAVRVGVLGPVVAGVDLWLPAGAWREVVVLCADVLVSALVLGARPVRAGALAVCVSGVRRTGRDAAARVGRWMPGRGPRGGGVAQ